MSIFKGLKFGGVDSADYGIYITGEAVYNAPTRAVEMVNVAGRNGAIVIDQGRWENIEVIYPAGTFADTQGDFATAMASFRNAIVSQTGYQVLTDDYHPEEYRMATYIDGLEVEPVQYGTAGQFEIRFNCKPQRWLLTGEEEISVISGASVPNPTLYESSPLIKTVGYGTIAVGDYEIEIDNAVMGDVQLISNGVDYTTSYTAGFASTQYNTGDTITISASTVSIYIERIISMAGGVTSVSNVTGGTFTKIAGGTVKINIEFPTLSFAEGTDTSDSYTCSGTVTYPAGDSSASSTFSATITRTYDASEQTITWAVSDRTYPSTYFEAGGINMYYGDVYVASTISMLGNPTYLDCDLGVCYRIESDEVIDLNAYIDLGSDLPVLVSGSNLITYDNTITSLIIIPRWWQL